MTLKHRKQSMPLTCSTTVRLKKFVEFKLNHFLIVPSLVNLNENVSVSKGESLVYYLTEGINVLGSRPPTTSQEWVSMCNAKQQNSDNEVFFVSNAVNKNKTTVGID